MTTDSPIKVDLVDDHELVRRGVAAVLAAEPDIDIVAQFSDAEAAVQHCVQDPPDVVLMDLRMPGTPGLQATAMLHEQAPDVTVLVLTVSEQAQDLHVFAQQGKRSACRQSRSLESGARRTQMLLDAGLMRGCGLLLRPRADACLKHSAERGPLLIG